MTNINNRRVHDLVINMAVKLLLVWLLEGTEGVVEAATTECSKLAFSMLVAEGRLLIWESFLLEIVSMWAGIGNSYLQLNVVLMVVVGTVFHSVD